MPTSSLCLETSSIMRNISICLLCCLNWKPTCTSAGWESTRQGSTSSRISRIGRSRCKCCSPRLTQAQQVKSQQLQEMILKARQRQLKDKGTSHETIKSQVFGKPWVSSQTLMDLGYLDSLQSYYEVHRQNADGVPDAPIDIPFRLNMGNSSRIKSTSTFTSFILGRFTS